MLVATPAQTAARYPLHSSAITSTTTTGSSATTTSKLLSNNHISSNSLHGHKYKRTESSGANKTSALMKTLSVRLNRGTEFLKSTVQKALVSTTTTTNSTHYRNQHSSLNHNVTAPTASSIRNSVADFPAATNRYSTVTASAATSSSAAAVGTTPSTLARTIGKASAISAQQTLYTVPPTATHRFSEERKRADSVDSLHREMCHFKPIRAVPTTPWKCSSRSRGACLRIPRANLATNTVLISNCDDERNVSDDDDNKDRGTENTDGNSSNDVKIDKLSAASKFYRPKPSPILLLSSPRTSQQSAFVCLAIAPIKNLTARSIDTMKAKKLSNRKSNKKTELKKTRGRTKNTRKITQAKYKNTTVSSGIRAKRTRSLMLQNGQRRGAAKVAKPDLKSNVSPRCVLMQRKSNKRSKSTGIKKTTTKRRKNIKKSSAQSNKKINSRMVNKVKFLQKQRKQQVQQQQKSDISERGEIRRSGRKRKILIDLNVFHTPIKPSKSARLTSPSTPGVVTLNQSRAFQCSICSNECGDTRTGSGKGRYDLSNRCSPPLTRARLKQMPYMELCAPLEYNHRMI